MEECLQGRRRVAFPHNWLPLRIMQASVTTKSDKPVILAVTNYFGHWYHSFADTFIPIFVTKRLLGVDAVRVVEIAQVTPQPVSARLLDIAETLGIFVEFMLSQSETLSTERAP